MRAYDLLQESLHTALAMCATMQVMIGVTMLFTLLSKNREVVRLTAPSGVAACKSHASAAQAKTFMYWNVILRGMYHCSDATIFRMKLPGSTSHYQKQAWQALDAKVAPVTSRVPALNRAKEAAAAWFRG